MKVNVRIKKLVKRMGKYKYTVLILLVGIVLMLLPSKEKEQAESPTVLMETEQIQQEEYSLEEKLVRILEKMDGVGKADVLLTIENGPSYDYQTNTRTRRQDDSEETETETVLVSDGTKGEEPITVSTKYPTYQGALILCQGADSAYVRLQITQAVSDLTGLGSDRISVVKMKDN